MTYYLANQLLFSYLATPIIQLLSTMLANDLQSVVNAVDANQQLHVVVESRGFTHANEASDRDDVATDEDVIGNVAESKSPALTSPSDQLHPSLMEDCNQLGNVVKMNEILDPNPKPEDNNNSVFEHLMHHYLDSQNLVSNPPSPTADCVPLEATLLEQLA